ncbi:MAG: NAD(P)/FAD-dependent oxidoreductase, partial [Rhodoglobus sp.]
MGRIMPEVSLKTSLWVIKDLAERGAKIHLDTQLSSAVGGHIELSTGESFDSDLIVWTAGVMANPVLRNTDLPVEERGRLRVQADMRVINDDGVVEGAWGAGDVSAVPDLTGGGVAGFCVPNAQHAVRQAKLLAKNVVAVLRDELPNDYFHKNAGAVAGLGVGNGVFQSGNIAIKGLPAWFMHRGYHGLAMPMWERKVRVFGNWIIGFLFGRDQIELGARATPRAVFEEFASRPKPAAPAPVAAAVKAPAKVTAASTKAPAAVKAPAKPRTAAAKKTTAGEK